MSLQSKLTEKRDYFESLGFNPPSSKIKIKYGPFDLFEPKSNAKIIFLGLTPGSHQLNQAEKVLAEGLKEKLEIKAFEEKFRTEVPFDGSMKENLINMLDEVGLPHYLKINSTRDLFGSEKDQAEMTSLLKMPVFVNDGENYSGTPHPMKKEELKKLIELYFLNDLEKFNKDVLIIPFGKTVYTTLEELNICKRFRVLKNFPHPSGANGHRIRIFNEFKEEYMTIFGSKI